MIMMMMMIIDLYVCMYVCVYRRKIRVVEVIKKDTSVMTLLAKAKAFLITNRAGELSSTPHFIYPYPTYLPTYLLIYLPTAMEEKEEEQDRMKKKELMRERIQAELMQRIQGMYIHTESPLMIMHHMKPTYLPTYLY